MTEKQIMECIDYIMTHEPKSTEFETIDVAIRAVTGTYCAATQEEMVNPDDTWMIPPEEGQKFAGVRSRAGVESLDPQHILLFEKAAKYVQMTFIKNEITPSLMTDDFEKLRKTREELFSQNFNEGDFVLNDNSDIDDSMNNGPKLL